MRPLWPGWRDYSITKGNPGSLADNNGALLSAIRLRPSLPESRTEAAQQRKDATCPAV